MELTTFSVLDIVLITGLLLLLFRAYKNGALNELVYLSVASLYVYVVLNNLNAVFSIFDENGFEFARSLYNVFVLIFAVAGLPIINFFLSLYVPKVKGSINLISGSLLTVLRYMLLMFFVLQIFPFFNDYDIVNESFIVRIFSTFFLRIFIYLF